MTPASKTLAAPPLAMSTLLMTLPAARAHEAAASDARVVGATVRSVSSLPSLPSLRATWRVHFEPARMGRGDAVRVQTWQLRRDVDRIVWSKGEVSDEIWTRHASGVALERVLHRQRSVVEYTAGELRTPGVDVDWRELGTLFAERDLRALSRVPDPRLPSGLERWRGTMGSEQVDLVWDRRALLPVKLVHSSAKGRVRYALEGMTMGVPAQAAAEVRTAGYARIDAADFGDMEYDPVVRLAQAQDERRGWRRAHAH